MNGTFIQGFELDDSTRIAPVPGCSLVIPALLVDGTRTVAPTTGATSCSRRHRFRVVPTGSATRWHGRNARPRLALPGPVFWHAIAAMASGKNWRTLFPASWRARAGPGGGGGGGPQPQSAG